MDIAIRVVVKMNNLSFQGTELININNGGDVLPDDLKQREEIDGETWFDIFNPSKLAVPSNIAPAQILDSLELITEKCADEWAKRPQEGETLTAKSLYQFTRVLWTINS